LNEQLSWAQAMAPMTLWGGAWDAAGVAAGNPAEEGDPGMPPRTRIRPPLVNPPAAAVQGGVQFMGMQGRRLEGNAGRAYRDALARAIVLEARLRDAGCRS
jgi:hypothetical protein